MKTLQHTANQHNTVEHNTILAQITLAKGSLFSDFRVPDMLSTFTWGNEHALDLLFDTTKYIPHDLLFVHNSVVKQFVDSIEHSARSFVPPNGQAGGLEHNAATCIAVWQHGGEHSLVSVANTAFYQWQKSPNLPPFLHVGGIGYYVGGIMTNLECSLRKGTEFTDDLFVALGCLDNHGNSPIARVQQELENFLNPKKGKCMTTSEDSLLLQAVDGWIAREQNKTLKQSLGVTNSVVHKRIL